MLVHFYEVRNCTFETFKGGPVLFAPGDIDYDILMKRGFRRNKEERWFRPVNTAEYRYIVYSAQFGDVIIDERTVMYGDMPAPYGQPPQDNTPNILCFVSVGLMALGFPVSALGTVILGGLFFLAALILMIIVRVRYPENQFGRILCIIYIVLAVIAIVLTIAAAIILAIICNQLMADCESCCNNMPG